MDVIKNFYTNNDINMIKQIFSNFITSLTLIFLARIFFVLDIIIYNINLSRDIIIQFYWESVNYQNIILLE